MKLAFCLFNYFPYGGMQRDFLRIAELCLARKHAVTIFTMRVSGELDPRFDVRVIKVNGWQNHSRIKSFVKKMKHELAQAQFDLVIGFDKMPFLDVYYAADRCYAGRVATKKSITPYLTWRYWQLTKMERGVFQKGLNTKILLISPREKEIFQTYYKTEEDRFINLPPNLDRRNIAPDNAQAIRQQIRMTLNRQARDILLLLVGSSFKTKGVKRAIKALAKLPHAVRCQTYLYVIGQDDSSEYQKLAQNLHVSTRVIFLGSCDHVRDYMLAADILVHPARQENTGTVLLEAAIAGLPVLTLAHCGYAHYIETADLGVVLPGLFSLTKFSQAILSMLQQPARMKQWQRNGIAFSKREYLYQMPEKVVEIIEDLVQAKQHKKWQQDVLYFTNDMSDYFSKNVPLFEQMMNLQGEIYRCKDGRLTQRVIINERAFFIKQHFGVGKKEVLKNWVQLRRPVTSAENEWQAITKLQQVGVGTAKLVAYGMRGNQASKRESFVLMEEIKPAISLEDYITTPFSFKMKRKLTHAIARIAAALHENGVNHRDFYLCHFLLNPDDMLYLIDLHRAEIRSQTPNRWVIKDLASLYFSSKGVKLTSRDLYRFIKSYRRSSLRNILGREEKFWQKVKQRGDNYRDHTQG